MREREKEQYVCERDNNISNYVYILIPTLNKHKYT